MATYSYVILDKQGKKAKGSIKAESREAAVTELRNNGKTLVSIEAVGTLNKNIEIGIFEKKPKPRDLAVFCRQFVSIISAGVPLISAFEMLSEQTENKKLANAIVECKKTIELGETLAHAMSRHPAVFSPMFVTLVEAGEASGSLENSFSRMADQFEKEAKLKATVKKATIYPIVIGVIAFFAVILLLTFVVPTFEGMLNDLGVELPGVTKFVLAASSFIQHRWYVVAVFLVALFIGLRIFRATDSGKHFFGGLAIRLPLIGNLTTKTASARMSRTLSTLLGAGLPLIDALSITANTMTNIYFKEQILEARDQVMVGAPLATQFAKGKLFPPLVHHMISIGEDTGGIDGMLTKLAEYYEDEVESATQQVMAALEPAIIVTLALVIGTIVISIVLPMASMYDGLNNL
ncbi:MAG: type II secretion system F family protein [Oscillospiraceae bacterium]